LAKYNVEKFLNIFKNDVEKYGMRLWSRPVNDAALEYLEYNLCACIKEITDLVPADNIQGPEEDDKSRGIVCMFEKRIKGKDIYIKLLIRKNKKSKFAECESFNFSVSSISKKKG